MVAIPASVKRTVIVRISLLMGLHGQIRRAHDTLTQIVHAVQVMAVVIDWEGILHSRDKCRVDARHHELLLGTSAVDDPS